MKLELLLEMKFQKLEEKVGKGKITEELFNQIHEKIEEVFPENLLNNYVIGWCNYWIKFSKDTTEIQFLEFIDHFCTILPQTWNWNAYRTWAAVTERIDFLVTQNAVKDKITDMFDYRDTNQPGFLWKSDDNKCFLWKAETVQDTIRFGKGYSFCISRANVSGNMYWHYRFDKASSFHFLWNENHIGKDEFITVIDHTKRNYEFTHKNNATGGTTTRYKHDINYFISKYPEVSPIKSLVKNIPIGTNEQEEYNWAKDCFQKGTFLSLSKSQKLNYLKYGWVIPNNIKIWELDKDIIEVWMNFGHDVPGIVTWSKLSDSIKTRWLKVREQNNMKVDIDNIESFWNYNDYPELLDDVIKIDTNTTKTGTLTVTQVNSIPERIRLNNELFVLKNSTTWDPDKSPKLIDAILAGYKVNKTAFDKLKQLRDLTQFDKFIKINYAIITLDDLDYLHIIFNYINDKIGTYDREYNAYRFNFSKDFLYNLPNEFIRKYPNIVKLTNYAINPNRRDEAKAVISVRLDRCGSHISYIESIKTLPTSFLYKDIKLFRKLMPYWIYTEKRPNDINIIKQNNLTIDFNNISDSDPTFSSLKNFPELWLHKNPEKNLEYFVLNENTKAAIPLIVEHLERVLKNNPNDLINYHTRHYYNNDNEFSLIKDYPIMWVLFKGIWTFDKAPEAFDILNKYSLLSKEQYPETRDNLMKWLKKYSRGNYIDYNWRYVLAPEIVNIALQEGATFYKEGFNSIPKNIIKENPELWTLCSYMWTYKRAPEALPILVNAGCVIGLPVIRRIPLEIRQQYPDMFIKAKNNWNYADFPEGLKSILKNVKVLKPYQIKDIPEDVLYNTIMELGKDLMLSKKLLPKPVLDKLTGKQLDLGL